MTTVLVLGAYGLVGASLCPHLEALGYLVLRQGRRYEAHVRFNPLQRTAVSDVLATFRPDAVVNLAGATDVEGCEVDIQAAYLANVRTVEVLVEEISAGHSPVPHLVQISTDQVYDGTGPHRESDANPCNVYALSKYTGELVATQVGATVLRTNLFGRSKSPGRASLSDWMVRSLRAGTPITVFDDVMFSALHLDTLSNIIARAVQCRIPGVFNAGCRDGISKAGFAMSLASHLSLDRQLMMIGTSAGANFRARRPLDMRMDPNNFERAFRFDAPTMESQIQMASLEYQNGQTRS